MSTQSPTAVARVLERLSDAEGRGQAQEIFDAALFVSESVLKYLVVTGVSLLRASEPSRADQIARRVIRGDSDGVWITALREVADRASRSSSPGSRSFAAYLKQKHRPAEAPPSLADAVTALGEVVVALEEVDYTGSTRQRHSVQDLLSDIVFIRNRTKGHGAHQREFFEAAASPFASAARKLADLVEGLPTWWLVDLEEAVPLIGTAPTPSLPVLVPSALANSPAGTYVEDGSKFHPVEGLAHVVASAEDTPVVVTFANGRWNDSSAICQFQDLSTGRTEFVNCPQYAEAAIDLPQSETAGRLELDWSGECAHNLPHRPGGYVHRPELEQSLTRLLRDRTHRVISLLGGGGMGKTALALAVLEGLRAESPPFDVILWFSARDIDLLDAGPADRRRDVSDLEDVAEYLCRLLGEPERRGRDALQYLTEVLGSGSQGPSFLLVLDNLETFENPPRLQQFFDETVLLPSKVLITSRHEEFRGDYPVPVGGMAESEAEQLLLQEGRRRYCEPALTPEVRARLITLTGSRAYALKLAVGEIARGRSIDDVARSLRGRTDILAALFDRSVEQLSADARFLYLLLGATGTGMVEAPVKALCRLHGIHFEAAAEELEQLSLAERDRPSAHERRITLPQMAFFDSQRRIVGDPDEVQLRGIADQFKEWSAPRVGLTSLQAFFENLFDGARSLRGEGIDRREELFGIAEHTAEDHPELWLRAAREMHAGGVEAERVRIAYKRAAEEDPQDAGVWKSWAQFEDEQGDRLQFIHKSIRAVEADDSDPNYCSNVAYDLADYVSANKESMPVVQRSFYVTSVRDALQRHQEKDRLSATDLSRLGWLFFLEFAPGSPDLGLVRNAYRYAALGMRKDSRNLHCSSLMEKALSELRRAGLEPPELDA